MIANILIYNKSFFFRFHESKWEQETVRVGVKVNNWKGERKQNFMKKLRKPWHQIFKLCKKVKLRRIAKNQIEISSISVTDDLIVVP